MFVYVCVCSHSGPRLPEAGIVPGEMNTLLILLGSSLRLHMFVQKVCTSKAMKSPWGLWLRLCVEGKGWSPETRDLLERWRGLKERRNLRLAFSSEVVEAEGRGSRAHGSF